MAKLDLTKYGITGTTEVVHNPSYEQLFAEETNPELEGYEKGQVSELGAVNVMTGIYTGRSPKDKFIVMDENSKDTVWWTSDEYKNDNHPASQEAWKAVKEIARLTAIGGDLTLDDLPGLAGVFDLSKYAFSEHSAVTLRFVSTPKLTELRGGGFAGSLSLDAAALAPQPETMPFALSGFERLDVLHVVGFKGLSALSLPVAACTDLLIENCGTQRAFALSLPALEEVRGTLLCKNCGKTGAANSASFPRLRSIGRQLAFYVNVSSFASLAFPELERVGDGLGVSDDASSDYAFYTMPSGCTGAFVLPKLKEVRGNMLLSTWNASTDRVAAFRFPALETVTGELFVGHASYKNRTVTALDFSALRQVGSVYVGNLSSATDFSTFAGALPSLSDATWRVENCGENPTYEQMLGGQTGRP
mgnify:CR=1 FL=1